MFAIAGILSAQETRREIVNAAPTPEGDTKKNSDKVPDVYAIKGQFERILVLRFKFDVDLLAGMEKMVKQEKIRNAVVLSGAGSVRGYQIHQVNNRDFPSKNMFVKNPTEPADLISMNGYVINGKIHAHMTTMSHTSSTVCGRRRQRKKRAMILKAQTLEMTPIAAGV